MKKSGGGRFLVTIAIAASAGALQLREHVSAPHADAPAAPAGMSGCASKHAGLLPAACEPMRDEANQPASQSPNQPATKAPHAAVQLWV